MPVMIENCDEKDACFKCGACFAFKAAHGYAPGPTQHSPANSFVLDKGSEGPKIP